MYENMDLAWVAARWQLANAEVDDDQRHSTLLLGLLLGRLLKVALFLDVSLKSLIMLNLLLGCGLALPLIDILSHILSWLR